MKDNGRSMTVMEGSRRFWEDPGGLGGSRRAQAGLDDPGGPGRFLEGLG